MMFLKFQRLRYQQFYIMAYLFSPLCFSCVNEFHTFRKNACILKTRNAGLESQKIINSFHQRSDVDIENTCRYNDITNKKHNNYRKKLKTPKSNYGGLDRNCGGLDHNCRGSDRNRGGLDQTTCSQIHNKSNSEKNVEMIFQNCYLKKVIVHILI